MIFIKRIRNCRFLWLKDYKGAYKAGLFHMRRTIALSPNNLIYREMLLFFGSILNKLISNQKLREICQLIKRL